MASANKSEAKARETIPQIREAPVSQPKMIRREYTIETPQGEWVWVGKGPAGAVKIQSTESSLAVCRKDSELPEFAIERARKPTPRAAPRLSGNPDEPGGTITESLDGDEDTALAQERALADKLGITEFLKKAERDTAQRFANE